MPTTITSYVTFVAGTKARASHVNSNLDNHRGTLLPINSDTQTASDATHDLGSSEHRWRNIYLQNAPFVGGLQLSRFEIETFYDGSVPADLVEDTAWLGNIAFPKDLDTSVRCQFIVPQDYTPGNRISLDVKGYCQTGGSHITLETVAALYRVTTTGGDNMSLTSPANVLTSTSNINPPTTSGLAFSNISLRLTDASGRINSISVSAGDVLSFDLKRKGTATADTNTGYFYLTNVIVDLNN